MSGVYKIGLYLISCDYSHQPSAKRQ